ncbi:MAG: hypothetical protein HY075_05940 [Deltaproteobacteria bacterium]|nr:hypothetical protein [Deltaproteobacteria bacterium]
MSNRFWSSLFAVICLLNPSTLRAGDFEIFDGRTYNGKFYPRIDVIEWNDKPGDPSYMDFHIYSKDLPIDLSFQLEQTDKKKVMLVNYFIEKRNEHLCRRVLAPGHFTEGYYVYRDSSDPDYESVIVSMYEMPAKKGRSLVSQPKKYAACVVDEPTRLPAGDKSDAGEPSDQVRPKGDKGAIKSKGAAVPFGDW